MKKFWKSAILWFYWRDPVDVAGYFLSVRLQHYGPSMFLWQEKNSCYEKLQVQSYIKFHWHWNCSELDLYMSERSMSLASKQTPYELHSLYRTRVIIFSGDGMPKKNEICEFCTPAPQKMHDIGCWNFARMLYSMESTILPSCIEIWEGWLWSVIFWHGMTQKWFISKFSRISLNALSSLHWACYMLQPSFKK